MLRDELALANAEFADLRATLAATEMLLVDRTGQLRVARAAIQALAAADVDSSNR